MGRSMLMTEKYPNGLNVLALADLEALYKYE